MRKKNSKITEKIDLPLPGNRSFGLLFTVIFLGLACRQIFKEGFNLHSWMWLGAAGVIAFISFFCPDILLPFNRAWMRLGVFMNKIVSPVVLGFLYIFLIVPTGFFIRIFSRDAMNRKFDTSVKSYWQARNRKILPENFINQF